MKPGQLMGALIIGVCILVAGFSLRGSVQHSLSLKEAMAARGEPCALYGEVIKSSTHYNMQAARLDFVLRDASGTTMPVVYQKSKPANFDQAKEIRVLGAYRDGAFQAGEMFLKCPSKYIAKPEAPGKAGAEKNPYAALGKGA
jgi:cytochrome c-type biogenesis protein CcmE